MDALGVDIGGVIIDRINNGTDTSFFGPDYLAATATPGVFEALAQLVRERFGDNTYLVSKCTPKTAEKSMEWLAYNRFEERTGIALDRMRFCQQRSGKAAIAIELGLTHFVDDRLEVLGYLTTVPWLYLYRPQSQETHRHWRHLNRVRLKTQLWSPIVADMLSA